MRCPRCNQEGLNPYGVCARCEFSGSPGRIEELGHIAYLLGELETWCEIGMLDRNSLRERYLGRRQDLEVDLGLRLPPLTGEQVHKLHWELFCLEKLQEEVALWLELGWVRPGPGGRLRRGAGKRAEAVRQNLAEASAPPAMAFDTPRDRLGLLDYLERILSRAQEHGHFVDDRAYASALADLQDRRHRLEIEAGLRPRPAEPVSARAMVPTPSAVPEMALAAPTLIGAEATVRKPQKPPGPPITWERIWQTLLSERTLNVLLFLGAFLLMASATTYVVYNWKSLPAAVQLAFIVLFTLSFYGAGWFLRVRMRLRLSGIAVTAVGSLLIPLDFYAIFVAGGVLPAESWPWVWLMASAVCLPIYAFTTLRIRAPFFGYLVAVAAGSLLCAALQVLAVPPEWWLAALVALALVLAILAYRLGMRGGAWSVFSNPLRFSALLGTAVLLPLGVGWWIAAGASGLHFDLSLAGAWALGAVLFGYTAAREQSPMLGRAAATALPLALFFLLRLAFEPLAVEAPWYALGWAALVPAYLWVGHRCKAWAQAWQPGVTVGSDAVPDKGDPVLCAHSHTATGWGLALMAAAALWSAFDLWAAAATHAALTAGAILAVRLWDRPRALPVASLLAFSSVTFAMAAAHLEPAELCLGWALLAVLHVIAALPVRAAPDYASRLFAAATVFAFLALLPPAIFGHEPLLTYILGTWIALAAWLLWLDYRGEHPGLTALLQVFGPLRQSLLHWAAVLPLPLFATLLYTRFRAPDAWLGLLLAALAWICFGVGRLGVGKLESWSLAIRRWSFPWYVVGYGCSLATPLVALRFQDQPLLAVTVLSASALYFASAWTFRASPWLVPAGLALPLGLLILLDFWAISAPQQGVGLALVAAVYLLGGVWLERMRRVSRRFLAPLYATAHVVASVAVLWGFAPFGSYLFDRTPWADTARLWAAGGQFILAMAYGLFAWFHNQARWAHVAAWLGVLAGGLAATVYSQGRGSAAFKAALLAAAYVLAERALASEWLQQRWPPARQAWRLYRRALLLAGWAVSAGAIALAVFRNLMWLGGGRVQTVWAIAGLLTVTALYALAARLFRRRVFVWLAAVLVIMPWTLFTIWGWFLWDAPSLPQYALSWAALACLELFLGLGLLPAPLRTRAGSPDSSPQSTDYGSPLRVIANVLLPFALLWGVADPATSTVTWGLGLAFYAVSAVADHRREMVGWRRARFLYPAVVAIPVWTIYLLYRFAPTATYGLYGLTLLGLALPLLAVGRQLHRIDLADGLPLYLGAYGVAIVGTTLVAHQYPLLAVALTFDALLCVLSARLFREPLWLYPATALVSAALLVALIQGQVPPDRRGWWLVGLGAIYLVLSWALRRLKLRDYARPVLVASFAVVALGLPPSSLDDTGAFWGYLAAALFYAVAAAWLRQPLLLFATSALLAVPYGVALVWLEVSPAHYGLALFPGVVAALALAHLLDWRLGSGPSLFPSWEPKSWRLGVILDWWAAPWYIWGYAGALVAVGLSLRASSGQPFADSTRLALVLGLAALTFFHTTWRFRSRGALLLSGVLAQGAVLAVIDANGWLAYPAWAALAFLPATVVTAALAMGVQLWRQEGSPLTSLWWKGWSRPFYLLLAIDLLVGQAAALWQGEPGAIVTFTNALLLALLATVWAQPVLPFAATGLVVVGLFQAMAGAGIELTAFPVGLAALALGCGLVGYGIDYAWMGSRHAGIWRKPLEWIGLALSAVALVWVMWPGLDVMDLLVRTLFGRPVTFADYASQVRMVMWVLALNGLLYLATAAVRRCVVLGYGAVALLLAAWALWWRFFLDMAGFQWYAVPAGLYLLGVGWLEWRRGRKTLARWIDRAGMLVWLGTAWWQSLPGVMPSGWPYALIMGFEALVLIWWGSARRQKSFLYIGAVAVVLNVVTQSIEPLLSVNRWIVFGLAGLLLVGIAVLVERKLEAIREMSADLRGRLAAWE